MQVIEQKGKHEQARAGTRHGKSSALKRDKLSQSAPKQQRPSTDQPLSHRSINPAYLQSKLKLTDSNDPLEREADSIADQLSKIPFDSAIDTVDTVDTKKAQEKTKNIKDIDHTVQAKKQPAQSANQSALNNGSLYQSVQEKGVEKKSVQENNQDKVSSQASSSSVYQAKVKDKGSALPQDADPTDHTTYKAQDFEATVAQQLNSGQALDSKLMEHFSRLLKTDLSQVKIHTDAKADSLCEQINARAFTYSEHIFFASGQYAPNEAAGRWLIAHELGHVLQQSKTQAKAPMRSQTGALNNSGSSASGSVSGNVSSNQSTTSQSALPSHYSNNQGQIDTVAKTLRIKRLQVPRFKYRFYNATNAQVTPGGLLTWRRNASTGGTARDTNQIPVWESEVNDQVTAKLEAKFRGAHRTEQAGQYIYYFNYNGGKSYLIGTQTEIKNRCKRPMWRRSGTPAAFQVDHQVEYQTGGLDDISNMWLLEGYINGKSGREIKDEIRAKVAAFVSHVQTRVDSPPPDINSARKDYVVYFDPVRTGLGSYPDVRAKEQYYTLEHIKKGDHLSPLRPMSQREIDQSGLMAGDADNIHIFPSAIGGYHYQMVKAQGEASYQLSTASVSGMSSQNFDISTVNFNAQTKQGSIQLRFPSQSLAETFDPHLSPQDLEPVAIAPMSGVAWGGRFDKNSLKRQVKAGLKSINSLSPLAIDQVDINAQGIVVTGVITPTLPLIENSAVNFSLSANELRIWKTFQNDDIKVPSPFSIDSTSLTLGASNTGLSVAGQVAFAIDKLGKGQISATGEANFDRSTAIALAGEFDFDERIFGQGNSAKVQVGYAQEMWSMGGTLNIVEGKIKGIKSANINVQYSESQGFSAIGEAQLSIPGVESGRLEISQSEQDGFAMKGEFALSSQAPGIRGGKIAVALVEREDGSGFALSASGEAQPDIPGVDSNLLISYDDGTFSAEAQAAYERGMLSGELLFGVTNRTVTEDGGLSQSALPDNPLVVYGGGELTLQLTPWLAGTAGVDFAPDGEITVSGEIGLPDALQIFDRKELNKSLFNIAVQAPIFPGIVAEIGGGLSAKAGIGPGMIDQLRLGIVYNPAREQDTTITGNAHLRIPADAGLRLNVRAGIGLGITGASVTGGLDIGGTLGIAGAAQAGVDLNWTPSNGLDITASVSLQAQPSFTFDIGGYVDVRALGMSVYDNRWELASYTFGSDYLFGIALPVHYQEGKPFNVSLSDVQFQVPDINTNQLMRGLIARIA